MAGEARHLLLNLKCDEEKRVEFEKSYFEGETREDFYIRPMVKRAWAAQLEVLHEIDVICRRHNIKYFAEWGTLLGAVRHKGFIPWDDDLDIGMKREDYNLFLKHCLNELPKGLEIRNFYTEETYGQIMTRIVTGSYIRLDEEYLTKYHGCPYVVGVDIFPMDYIPRNKQDEEIQLKLLVAANLLAQTWQSEHITEEEKMACLKELTELTGAQIREGIPVHQQLYQLSDSICALYHEEDSDEITLLCMLSARPHYRLPKQCYDYLIDMPFENTVIPVPEDYDRILKLRYGENYMVPVKHWGTHDYPFFKKQEQQLKMYYENEKKEMPQCFAE